jgi:hypothetical protein
MVPEREATRGSRGSVRSMLALGSLPLLAVTAAEVAFIFRLVTSPPTASLVSGVLVCGLMICLLWLWPQLQSASLSATGLQLVKQLAKTTDDLHGDLAQLVLLSMSEQVYKQLRRLADGSIGDANMGESFRRELGYLDVLGYVRFPIGGLAGMRDGQRYDMRRHAEVTELGRRFLRLHEEAQRTANPPTADRG